MLASVDLVDLFGFGVVNGRVVRDINSERVIESSLGRLTVGNGLVDLAWLDANKRVVVKECYQDTNGMVIYFLGVTDVSTRMNIGLKDLMAVYVHGKSYVVALDLLSKLVGFELMYIDTGSFYGLELGLVDLLNEVKCASFLKDLVFRLSLNTCSVSNTDDLILIAANKYNTISRSTLKRVISKVNDTYVYKHLILDYTDEIVTCDGYKVYLGIDTLTGYLILSYYRDVVCLGFKELKEKKYKIKNLSKLVIFTSDFTVEMLDDGLYKIFLTTTNSRYKRHIDTVDVNKDIKMLLT